MNYEKDITSFYVRCSSYLKVKGWLRNAPQSIKTPCNELGDTGLLEQPWSQLICSYKLYGCNFREWSCKKL